MSGHDKHPGVLAGFLLVLLLAQVSPALAGNMVDAVCDSCGYASGRLFIFGGRANFHTHCMFPALCPELRQVVLVNVLTPLAPPPGCSPATLKIYTDPALMPRSPGRSLVSWNPPDKGTVSLYEGGYLCPRCGRHALRFSLAGFWD